MLISSTYILIKKRTGSRANRNRLRSPKRYSIRKHIVSSSETAHKQNVCALFFCTHF
nr:MAG TPA: hypothetical protein [Caudoviricetes sp.]